MAGFLEAGEVGDRTPIPFVFVRNRTRNRAGASFRGEMPRRAPAWRPRPGQGTEVANERTPGGSKASKRACRLLTGEPDGKGKGGSCGHTRVCSWGQPSERGKPSSPAHASASTSGWAHGKELARRGKRS